MRTAKYFSSSGTEMSVQLDSLDLFVGGLFIRIFTCAYWLILLTSSSNISFVIRVLQQSNTELSLFKSPCIPGCFVGTKRILFDVPRPPSAVVTCLQLSTSCCCWRGTAAFCLRGRPLGLAADFDCSTLGLDLDETVLSSAVASNSPLEVDLGLGWDRWLPVLLDLDLDLSFSSSPDQWLSELVTLSLGWSSNNCDKKISSLLGCKTSRSFISHHFLTELQNESGVWQRNRRLAVATGAFQQ